MSAVMSERDFERQVLDLDYRRGCMEGSVRVEAERTEKLEAELDRIIEKRAAERRDANRVEELWKESARKVNGRRREESRALWYGYHMDQAERIERVASEIAASHRERAEELMSENKPHRRDGTMAAKTPSKQDDRTTSVVGGPKTGEGKEVARWNSTRHGIRSPAPVVPGVERPEDWEGHRIGILEDLAPSGHMEFTLAERVALLSWRLHRVTRYETETVALSQEKVVEDLRDRRRYESSVRVGSVHPEDALEAPKEARRTERVLKKFPDFPDDKKLSGADASAVLWAVVGRVDEEADIEELAFPGVPEWAGPFGDAAEWGGWSAGLVRECLDIVASAAGEDLEELMEGAKTKARLDVISAKHTAEEVEEQLRNMRRERLLPDVRTLDKVSRYEAHLSRLMFKALHELEALQTRKAGGAAPLARLDVDGTPEGYAPNGYAPED